MSAADTTTSAAAAPLSLVFGPQGRLLTAADLAALPTELPSGPVDYELDDGRLVVMSPTGRRHGEMQCILAQLFATLGKDSGHGRAFTETGIVLRRNPDRVVGPDVAFVTNARLPLKESPEGYLETIPDLVVEIRSKNDSLAELEKKAEDYLRAGVRVVWIVDCDARTVTVRRGDGAQQVLGEKDTLDADGVIPDMRVSVAALFGP